MSWASALSSSIAKPILQSVVLIEERRTQIGIEVLPGPNSKVTLEQFADSFEKHYACLSFFFHLKNGQDVFSQESRTVETKSMESKQLSGAVLQRTKIGLRVTLETSFSVNEIHRHKSLELCMGLTVNLPRVILANGGMMSALEHEEKEIRALLDMQRFHPPRILPIETSVTVQIVSPLRMFNRCRELSPFTSLLTVTVQNALPDGEVSLLDLTIHMRETIKDRGRFGMEAGSASFLDTASDFNDRLSATSSVAECAEPMLDGDGYYISSDLHAGIYDVHTVEVTAADSIYSFTPVSGSRQPVVTLAAQEAFTFAYIVQVKGADATPDRGASSVRLLAALGELATPFTLRWAHTGSLKSSLVRLNSLWSVGTGYIEHTAQGFHEIMAQTETVLDVALRGPAQAPCNQPFALQVLITNTSLAAVCDLTVVSAAAPIAAERQTSCVCFQASTPLKELSPGEQTCVKLFVLPLRSGPLKIDNISVVSSSGKIFLPPLILLIHITE